MFRDSDQFICFNFIRGTNSVFHPSDLILTFSLWRQLCLSYADESLLYQHKDIAEILKIRNEGFENICDWFVDNKVFI